MALPLFCEGLGDDLNFEAFFGVHLLQAFVLFLQLLHPGHERGVHAAKLGSPLVERGRAHAVFAAQLGDVEAGLGLLEDGDDLTVGVTEGFMQNFQKSYLENSTHSYACLQGGLPGRQKAFDVGRDKRILGTHSCEERSESVFAYQAGIVDSNRRRH